MTHRESQSAVIFRIQTKPAEISGFYEVRQGLLDHARPSNFFVSTSARIPARRFSQKLASCVLPQGKKVSPQHSTARRRRPDILNHLEKSIFFHNTFCWLAGWSFWTTTPAVSSVCLFSSFCSFSTRVRAIPLQTPSSSSSYSSSC